MYSPRTASYFLRRRTTQWVLALFLGTITVSFTELVAVGSAGRADYVPLLTVGPALLALFSRLVGFLALWQSVAGQLRVDSLLSTIGQMARTRLRRHRCCATSAGSPTR